MRHHSPFARRPERRHPSIGPAIDRIDRVTLSSCGSLCEDTHIQRARRSATGCRQCFYCSQPARYFRSAVMARHHPNRMSSTAQRSKAPAFDRDRVHSSLATVGRPSDPTSARHYGRCPAPHPCRPRRTPCPTRLRATNSRVHPQYRPWAVRQNPAGGRQRKQRAAGQGIDAGGDLHGPARDQVFCGARGNDCPAARSDEAPDGGIARMQGSRIGDRRLFSDMLGRFEGG